MITKAENIVLTEAWRRLHQFHKGDVNANLLLLEFPSKLRTLRPYLTPSNSPERERVLNWYTLTERGKKLMNQTPKMRPNDNVKYFEGEKLVNFNEYIEGCEV